MLEDSVPKHMKCPICDGRLTEADQVIEIETVMRVIDDDVEPFLIVTTQGKPAFERRFIHAHHIKTLWGTLMTLVARQENANG